MLESNYEHAILAFEEASGISPNNGVIRARAAEALILHMQHSLGPDIGFMVRARRHLSAAEQHMPKDSRVSQVKLAFEQLESGSAAIPTTQSD